MSAIEPDGSLEYAATSLGLWHLRRDLKQLFPQAQITHPFTAGSAAKAAYIGWGNRPSGVKARLLSKKYGKQAILLEGGFLHGFFPGRTEPQASYLIDRTGVHYDSTCPSDLENIIAKGISDAALLARARSAMDSLCHLKLSKYNSSPLLFVGEVGIDEGRPFVLLVDQVPQDASIAGSQADEQTFRLMLKEAIRAWPDHQIVVRPHLASKSVGHLQEASQTHPEVIVLKTACNIWPLLEQADHVYTVSSHCGFEALFCGTPVTCFGFPFYAGWGLTNDALSSDLVPNRRGKRSLEELFAASYIVSSQYLDMHDRKPTTLEDTIDTLSVIMESRARNRSFVATAGLSAWKRRAVNPFLMSRNGKPRHFSSFDAAEEAALAKGDGIVAVWGESTVDKTLPTGDAPEVVRLEDGFLRSTGLGAALRFPLSLVRDTSDHLYYDSRGRGMIETYLDQRPFSEDLIDRASRLIDQIVTHRLTKYRLDEPDNELTSDGPVKPDQLKILVTGQVENDASIKLSAPEVKTNTGLLKAVREQFPDAVIAYREHPDVAKNLRPGKADRALADIDGDMTSLANLLDWCDRLETLTSLTGFEALLRRKKVGVHGRPFYAGWGLTDDRLALPPRGSATLEELAVAALVLYPDYIHPESGLPCSPERAVRSMTEVTSSSFIYGKIVHPAGLVAGKIKHMFTGSQ